jgi:hypothetical protein
VTAPSLPVADPTNIEGRRICAWTIDLAIFLALFFGMLAATGGVSWQTQSFSSQQDAIDYCNSFQTTDEQGCVPVGDNATVVQVKGSANGVWFVNFLAYCLIQGITGGSIGKLIMGLRVVKADGSRAGIGKSFIRTILWIVDAITCGLPIVGGVLMLSTKGHRRVGDMGAGTFVVRKEHVGTPLAYLLSPAPVPVPYGYPPAGYGPPPGYGPPTGYGPATGYGPPSGYGPGPTWTPTDAPPAQVPPPDSVTAPATDGPHWDDARDTYIQFDRGTDRWVQWDDLKKEWRPIDE